MAVRIEHVLRLAHPTAVAALLSFAAPALPADGQGQYAVTMANMRYGAIPSSLKVGDTITWINRDTVVHTVTARDRSFDIRIPPGKQAKMTLTKSGKFAFYCILHPAMRGTLVVGAN